MVKAFAYHTSERPEIHALLPDRAGRALDVGCNDGGFGTYLRTRLGDCTLWGVEPNASQAKLAKAVLDEVVVGLYEPTAAPLATSQSFDLVTFNHVLEHTYDPWTLLADTRSILTPDGLVIAVIPNIRYLPTVTDLLVRGRWDYQDSGLLDRTHIRFFTRASIIQLFWDAGFEIEQLRPVNGIGSVRAPRLSRLVSRVLGDVTYGSFAVRAHARRTSTVADSVGSDG